jgi:REP element-mobilizing transposase RayT
MKYNPEIHHRRSIRLKDYDYSQAGAYFVTVCTQNRECLFGDITNASMQLNNYGEVVTKCWNDLSNHFPRIILDAFVVMPNHVHGIVVILENYCRGEVSSPILKPDEIKTIEKGGVTPPLQKHTLGQIVAYFKYQTTKHINQIRNTPGLPLWQRNYYEHIIRNEDELNRIGEYIINNPMQWADDENNPLNIKNSRAGTSPAPTGQTIKTNDL